MIKLLTCGYPNQQDAAVEALDGQTKPIVLVSGLAMTEAVLKINLS